MAGWRGRAYVGEYPTLGYHVIDWIEANLVVPDGPLVGEPFRLTDEQQRFPLSWPNGWKRTPYSKVSRLFTFQLSCA